MSLLTPPETEHKLSVLEGDSKSGDSCRTFVFRKESHTLGNCLRVTLLQNPQVVFAGYTIPHPSEEIMHLRIQTMDGYPAQTALRKAFVDVKANALQLKKDFGLAVQQNKNKS
ncbi:probable DNA-directed RNA polymerases I and III subunit RPAC2 [Eurytemora carolleeae]|uniref:probable DNA-directed RNA polymerases I and III subunit RPAC2 n=1 Tax=Eurytemora carolleeae TaxID=1294199 RepID=UPI000C789595|nr:probable DNA-directed RNA polymerases I and III subunit RPAC2 [Eurytemora carolleeae]|eukprot:XP_023333686.1 probable DNA-directed RNA polymerases I and III subunit RPAC2 [Eurytemora affinis]